MNKMIIFAGKLNDMKKVTELKDGMKVLIPFDVRENHENEKYPFILRNDSAFNLELSFDEQCHYWIGNPPLEIYEQEEIPTLTTVEMEVSDDRVVWLKRNVICKIGKFYKDILGNDWLYARPIQKTVTLEIPESELTDELRKYLKG